MVTLADYATPIEGYQSVGCEEFTEDIGMPMLLDLDAGIKALAGHPGGKLYVWHRMMHPLAGCGGWLVAVGDEVREIHETWVS